MATNNRSLKAYARFDGTGRIVPGSLVLRKNKPKVGTWKEVPYDLCCGGGCMQFTIDLQLLNVVINADEIEFPIAGYKLRIGGNLCNSSLGSSFEIIVEFDPINSLEELMTSLNQSASAFGEFSIYNNGTFNQIRLVTSCCLSTLSTCSELLNLFEVIPYVP
jgi:hypothetical protein